MKTLKQYSNLTLFSMLFMLTIFAAGCGNSDNNTAIVADTIAPTVTTANPADGTTNVAYNKNITALFSEELDSNTVTTTTFTLTTTADPATLIAGAVSYANKTMVFNPTVDLIASIPYTATISTGIKDLAGNAMTAVYTWGFTTGTASDTTAPTVTSTNPIDTATEVVLNKNITALFSEELDPNTVTTTTFTLTNSTLTTAVSGTVSYGSNTIVFNPNSDLAPSNSYTATITMGVKDLAGIAITAAYSWSFHTGTAVAAGPAPVNLGTAGKYVILAKTGISTTGTTAITGDIGVSPIGITAVTGFSETLFADGTYATSGYVTGKIYAANLTAPTPSNLTTAVSDMETAYTDAAGRTLPNFTELGAGDVSAKTLVPGLYKWGTGLLIDNRGVTISGGATDVWIFQIAGNLTVDNAAIVTLAGGALAENIFWQVAGGTGVTLGTTAQFKGVVLAQKGIVVNNLATVNGRLLAQSAVTLDANTVTQP